MAEYTLLLFAPVKLGQGFVEDVTSQAQNWQRAIRLQGGYWQGSFDLTAEPAVLQQWFYERLGYHLEERSAGQVTWEGLIYDLELTHQGTRMRRSLDTVQNAVRAVYSQWQGHVGYTDWLANTASSSRYGRKEELLSLEAMDLTRAAQQTTITLQRNAWPYPRGAGLTLEQAPPALTVGVCGYAFCANWRYVSEGWPPFPSWWDGTQQITLSEAIQTLAASNLSEFLNLGQIRANPLTIQKVITTPVRVWDFLSEMVATGDAENQPWRLHVGAGRRLHYEPVDITPRLFKYGGGLYTALGALRPATAFSIQPGVVRDVSYPAGRVEPGAFLADSRDLLVEEVQVDSAGRLSLRSAGWSEIDILLALAEQRADEAAWLRDFWAKAWNADYQKRKAAWEATPGHTGIPFPG